MQMSERIETPFVPVRDDAQNLEESKRSRLCKISVRKVAEAGRNGNLYRFPLPPTLFLRNLLRVLQL